MAGRTHGEVVCMLGLYVSGRIGKCYEIAGVLSHDGDCISSVAGLLQTPNARLKLLSHT